MDSAMTDPTSSRKAIVVGNEIALWRDWVSQQGAMGSRVASFGWAFTHLGAIETWSPG